MMRILALPIALISLLVMSLTSWAKLEPKTYITKVFYFPVGNFDTEGPVDEKAIEEASDLTGCLRTHAADLVAILHAKHRATKTFNHGQVRMKVVLPNGEIICVDKLGAVENIGKNGVAKKGFTQLRPADIKKITTLIRESIPKG